MFTWIVCLVMSVSLSYAQTSVKNDELKGWHLKDKTTDGYYGISMQQAYEFVKNRKSSTVLVAIIDSGIDTLQEDLKPIIWHNPKEIPGNGIDDDKNGYTDDVYGWNFIGGKDGRNVNDGSLEAARIYHSLKKKYSAVKDESKLTPIEKEEYRIYNKAKEDIETGSVEAQMEVLNLREIYRKAKESDSLLQTVFKPVYTGNELATFKPANTKAGNSKALMIQMFKNIYQMMDATNVFIMDDFTSYYTSKVKLAEAPDYAPKDTRGEIVKDKYDDFNDRYYGNPDVMGGNSTHGTHVSGIIGAVRNNGFGIDGVAENIRIMMIRAVPEGGDEYDKDIALAIRYAVDNGAKIINMSFGKGFSPQKKWVDDAIRYAKTKGVLIVHAAGNDGKNVDSTENYPSPYFADTKTKASNFITVGASGDPKTGGLMADFSNYGKKEVDVFAPGVKIYSTWADSNQYEFAQGTSMASPVVAGLAAFILSYYPELSAEQIKYCIEKGTQILTTEVKKPGTEVLEPFNDFSTTGGIINAYESVKIAATLKGERKAEIAPTPKPVPKPKTKLKKTRKG
jgi:cell wall-associated protease